MFQSCSQNAAKKSVTEKGSTPPAVAAHAATCSFQPSACSVLRLQA